GGGCRCVGLPGGGGGLRGRSIVEIELRLRAVRDLRTAFAIGLLVVDRRSGDGVAIVAATAATTAASATAAAGAFARLALFGFFLLVAGSCLRRLFRLVLAGLGLRRGSRVLHDSGSAGRSGRCCGSGSCGIG